MKKNFVVILVLLFLLILISGCINILPTLEEEPITPGKGRLKIYLTDSSEKYKVNDTENYLAVYITISKIEAHIAGDDDGDEGEWIILRDWSNENESELPVFDLMKLQDVSELLVDGSFDAGKYTQLRLFVTKASVLIETKSKESKLIEVGTNGEPVENPSGDQTGIKLIHPFEIIEGGETELTIDFDAEKSIIKTGNGNYKLKPTIKLTSTIVINTTENDNENE